MIRTAATIALTSLGLVLTAGTAAASDWCRLDDPAAWTAGGERGCAASANPQALPEELALPLPCGRQAVFRRIIVPASSPLDHELVWLGAPESAGGGADDLSAVVNAPRRVPLAGGFTTDGGRAYYIGKYELPAHHWDLFARGLFSTDAPQEHDRAACAEYDNALKDLTPRRALPAGGLSWYDATAFTRAWTEWLMALDRARVPSRPPVLPWEQGTPAFVRLPTEVEWEYAARGGQARQEDAVTAPTHLVRDPTTGAPRPGRLDEIAVLSQGGGAGSGGRRSPLQGIGTGLPNLAGLHDTLGNVDEIVFDLFTLTRPDRPHGQPGGHVVKGGNVFTPPAGLSVAHRREVPFFDLRGERRSAITGFRPLLAPPVFVSSRPADGAWQSGLHNPAQVAALGKARAALTQAGSTERAEVQEQLNRLGREADDGRVAAATLQEQLRDIQVSLDRSNAELNARDRDILRQQVQSVVLIGKTIGDIGTNTFVVRRDLEAVLADAAGAAADASFAKRVEGLRHALRNQDQSLSAAFGFYVGNVAALAGQPAAAVDDALAYLKGEMERQGLEVLRPTLDHVARHVTEMRAASGTLAGDQSREWLYTLDRTRRTRDERFGPQE